MNSNLRKGIHLAIAILPCIVSYHLSAVRPPDRDRVLSNANQYDFRSHQTAEPTARRHPARTILGEDILDPESQKTRHKSYVHPHLTQVEAWISALGAAVTAADLDLDGVPDDILHVDPRFSEITVSKAPFSPRSASLPAFALRPEQLDLNLAYGEETNPQASGFLPTGTLVADYNGDGWMDIVAYYWGRSPITFLRQPNVPLTEGSLAFEARELLPEPEIWHTNAAIQADLDGDGLLDLVFGNFFADHAPVVQPEDAIREKAPTLRRAALPEGIKESQSIRQPQMQASKAKATNGGDLHFFRGRANNNGGPDGTFERISTRGRNSIISREIEGQWVLAIGAADLDRDGLLDLYVANDFGPDLLLSNRTSPGGSMRFQACYGERGFTTPKSCVVGRDSFKGMGVCISDVNGDGFLDIQVGNIGDEFALQESHFVWQHSGDLEAMKEGKAPFFHASERLQLARLGWEWDTKCGDFNNDGSREILQACGFIYGEKLRGWASLHSVAMMNALALNGAGHWAPMKQGIDISGRNLNGFLVPAKDSQGKPVFENLNQHMVDMEIPGAPFPEPMVSRGIAVADMNGDGWLDFAIANQWKPSYIYQNARGDNGRAGSLTLVIVDQIGRPEEWAGPGNPWPAFGATVTVEPLDGTTAPQTTLVDPGNGHAGRSAPEAHFGLADNLGLYRVAVEYGITGTGAPRSFHAIVNSKDRRVALVLKQNDGGEMTVAPIKKSNRIPEPYTSSFSK